MNKTMAYSYTVLRYVHDIAGGEFVNVGVALYCPEARYASALCKPTYGRISRVFPNMNREYFKSLMRHVQARFEELGEGLAAELPFGSHNDIENLARSILPSDDSSLQWSAMGVGTTSDPAMTLERLFDRFVMRYEANAAREQRTNEDVWRTFKHTLESRQLLHHFAPGAVAVEDDSIEFQYSWKNGILHCLEPLSFDLLDSEGIRDKAHRWLGKITSVAKAAETFKVYFLVGAPQDESLLGGFDTAMKILRKIPVAMEVFPESAAEELGARIEREIAGHALGSS